MEWISQAKPNPDQVGPIEGLIIYEHALKCCTGSCEDGEEPYITISLGNMRNHLSVEHRSVRSKTDFEFKTDIRTQTFTHYGGFVFYFEVGGPPEDNVKFSESPLKYASLREAVQNEHKELLGTDVTVEDTINGDIIHPAFNSTGLIAFWESFNIDLVEPILEILFDPFFFYTGPVAFWSSLLEVFW